MSKFTATISFSDLNALKSIMLEGINLVSISEEKLPVTNYAVGRRAFNGNLVYTLNAFKQAKIDINKTLARHNLRAQDIMGTKYTKGTWQHSLKMAMISAA